MLSANLVLYAPKFVPYSSTPLSACLCSDVLLWEAAVAAAAQLSLVPPLVSRGAPSSVPGEAQTPTVTLGVGGGHQG